MMYLIVGLGNPGKKYEGNRHNVGFMAIDRLSKKHNIDIIKTKFKGLYGQGRIGSNKIVILKPQTYMNNSGESVQALANYFNIGSENIIIVTDDIDIAFGSVRIRKKGSAGTHNGLKSIVSNLSTSDFPRIKVAVGNKPSYMDLADFVLSNFSSKEMEVLEKELDLAVDAIELILEKGLDIAMNQINPISIV